MSDVTDAPRTAANEDSKISARGDFIWYELMTTDAEGAKAFYDTVVGWNISEGAPEFNGYRMIGRADGRQAGGVLPLTDEMQQHGARPGWLGYLGVDDVDSAVTAIEQAGGKALMPPFDIPNIGRIALVADPQGAPFYVMKPIPPEGRENEASDVFSPDQPGRCSWNELSTSDTDAARHFYGEQFGWTSDDFMPMGEMGEYRFLFQKGLRIGAVFNPNNGQPPHWQFYFRVPSISAAKQKAEQSGGTIVMGPMEVPGGDHIIVGIDPQGATFALVGGE
jgi:predicted enzyme related to lactoylglutathione lyase